MDSQDKKKQTGKNRTFLSSIGYALEGFRTVFKEERNMRFHCFGALLVIVAGWLFRLDLVEWLWILLAVFLVIALEMINTIFENVVDMVTDYQFHPIGKKVKDMAAAVVLLGAGFAVVVGAMIFLPKIWLLIFH